MQIFPHGLMLGPLPFRPVMIFKTQDEKEILPVNIDALNAGIMMAETEHIGKLDTAHKATLEIFEKMGVSLTSVYFNEIVGQEIMALLVVTQGEKTTQMRFKAREIMSLALRSGCAFFASLDVIEKSKLLNLEWAMNQAPQFEQGDKTLMKGPEWLH